VLSLIGLNNTSNKGQVSLKRSQFSTSQETAANGDVKVPLKAQCFDTASRVSAIYRILLSLCSLSIKKCALTTSTLLVQSVSSRVQSSCRRVGLHYWPRGGNVLGTRKAGGNVRVGKMSEGENVRG